MFSPKLFAYSRHPGGSPSKLVESSAVEGTEASAVSRRQFLTRGAALSGLTLASLTETKPISIERTTSGVVVHVDRMHWPIHAAAFGQHAAIDAHVKGSRALIRVRAARFEGTGLAFHLRLKIFEARRKTGNFDRPIWWLELKAAQLGYMARVPLLEWVRDEASAAIELPAAMLDHLARHFGLQRDTTDRGTFGPKPDFQWHFDSKATLADTDGSFHARAFRVMVEAPGQGLFDQVSDRPSAEWSTRVSTESIDHLPERAIKAGRLRSGAFCRLYPTGLKSATLQWSAGPAPERILRLSGAWRVRTVAEDGASAGGFESESGAVFIGQRNGIRHLAAILPLQEKLHAVQTDAGQMMVRGEDPGHRVALNVVGSDVKRAEARGYVHGVSLPLPGADYSLLDLGGVELNFVLDEPHITNAPDARIDTSGDSGNGIVVVGQKDFSGDGTRVLPLNKAELKVLRADDLLSLTFRFQHLQLVSPGRRKPWRLVPIAGATAGPRTAVRPVLIAEFPPQHVMEQCYSVKFDVDHDKVVWDGTQPSPPTPFVEARLSGTSRLAFEVPLPSGKNPGGLDYTLEKFTDWDTLPLVVSKVAEEYSTDGTPDDLAALLCDRGISQGTDLAKRWDEVLNPLTAPLNSAETAVELPARLMISPTIAPKSDPLAQAIIQTIFNASRAEGQATVVPLWQARLNVGSRPNDTRGIRAIHSPDLKRASLTGKTPYNQDPVVPWDGDSVSGTPRVARFPTAGSDRHQLVLLSSGVGLPTLPRLVPIPSDGQGSAQPPNPGINSASPLPLSPTNFPLDTNSKLKNWLLDVGGNPSNGPLPQGIYVPPSMPVRELTLSSLGGSLDVTALFEPPAAPNQNYLAFTLEKWKQKTILGRDITCEVDLKGFLFPLGHRCTWVRLTERYYLRNNLFGNPSLGGNFPTAYLVQRQFIVISRPDRNFPCIGHPYDARDFPGKLISIRTTRTPDIEDMSATTGSLDCYGIYPSGRINLPNAAGIVAWPRVNLGSGNEVRFQVAIDGAPSNVTMPLIFVDNASAHDSGTMRALVDWYMSLPAQTALRTAEHNGAARVYAPESTAGNTTFETRRWLMGARGRLDRPDTPYVMDAVMEGADQPPFYPYVVLSQLMVRSLQRFTGKTTSWIAASFEDSYANNGFAPAQNPSEIYLNIHGYGGDDGQGGYGGSLMPVALDLGGVGDRSGGVSKPSSQVVALSRVKGPVGGPKAPDLPQMPAAGCPPHTVPAAPSHLTVRGAQVRALTNARGAPVAARVTTPSTSDYSKNPSTSATSALGGSFDPLEFFGGASGTILGLIPIKDVIKAALFATAPKLLETLNNTATTIDNELKQAISDLGKACETAAKGIETALDKIDAKIQQVLDPAHPTPPNPLLSLRAFYPNLASAARALAADLHAVKADASVDPPSLDPLLNDFQSCVSGGKQIVQALGQIAANPAPGVLQDLLKWITGLRDPLALLVHGYLDQLNDLWAQARFAISSEICQSVNSHLWLLGLFNDGPQLLGEQQLPVVCTAQIDWTKPAEVKDYLTKLATYAGEALFCEVLSRPLLNLFTTAYQLVTDLQGQAGATVSALTSRAVKLIDQFFEVVNNASIGPQLAADWAANQCINAINFLKAASNGANAALAADAATLATTVANAQAQLVQFAALETSVLQTVQSWSQRVQQLQNTPPASDAIKDSLSQLQRAFASLKAVGATITQARLAAAAALTRLSSAIDEMNRQRKQLDDAASALSQNCAAIPLEVFGAASRVMSLRLRAIGEVQSFSGRIMDALSGTNFFEPPPAAMNVAFNDPTDLGTLKDALAQLQQDLVATLGSLFDNSHQLLQQGFVLIRDLTSLRLVDTTAAGKNIGLSQMVSDDAKAAAYAGDRVQTFNESAKTLWGRITADVTKLSKLKVRAQADVAQAIEIYHSLRPTFSDIVNFCGANERALVGLVGQSGAMANFADTLARKLVLTVQAPLGVLINIYNAAIQGLNGSGLSQLDDPNSAYSIALRLLLGKNDPNLLLFSPTSLKSQLQTDLNALNGIKTALTQSGGAIQQLHAAIPQLQQLHKTIEKRQLGILIIADQFGKLIDALSNGQLASKAISSLLDELKSAITTMLEESLPFTSINVGYDLNTDLRPIEPFFYPNNTTSSPRKPDLSISFKAAVNLLNLSDRHVQVTGTLQSFCVDIVGVVTLHFKPVTFNAQDGQKPALNISIDHVDIGEAAEFIKALQAWLSPGGGFYIDPEVYPPGIVAGFAMDCGTIGLGEVSFLNVSLGASMELPFDDRPALFRANVSTRENPFLISVFPFGGGGFLSVISDAHAIVGFEASFEFGAVVAFGFGPLSGQGLVTTGIYIAKLNESVTLSGFFLASGSAHLACFGIAASLLISIEQAASGDLNGNATFTFSFSMGFLHLSYSVGVTRKIGKGFSSGSGGVGGALVAPEREVFIAAFTVRDAQPMPPVVRTKSPNMATNWPAYAACFDATL